MRRSGRCCVKRSSLRVNERRWKLPWLVPSTPAPRRPERRGTGASGAGARGRIVRRCWGSAATHRPVPQGGTGDDTLLQNAEALTLVEADVPGGIGVQVARRAGGGQPSERRRHQGGAQAAPLVCRLDAESDERG